MSLENFSPQSFDKMGRTRDNKDTKDIPNVPDNETQDGNQANSKTADGLDPAVAKALSKMTSNIIKVIDGKLGLLAKTIHKHAMEVQVANTWLDEAEARLLHWRSRSSPSRRV